MTLPIGWVETTLGEVVNYGFHKTVSPEELNNDSWLLELEDVEKDSSKIIQRLNVADRQPKSNKNQFKKGDVLYGKLRPYLNKVVHANEDGYCTTEVIPISPGELNSRFLFYALKRPRFLEYVNAASHGMRMPRLGTKQAKAAPFILPPLAEQTRIAQKLDEVLAQVVTLKARVDALPAIIKRFRQSVLAAAVSGKLTEEWRKKNCATANSNKELVKLSERRTTFFQAIGKVDKPLKRQANMVDLEQLPDSWAYSHIDPFLDFHRAGMKTGPFGSLLKKYEHVSKGVPVLGIENINNGLFSLGSKIYITEEKASDLESYDIKAGDLVISRSGTVGDICVVPRGLGDMRFSTNLMRVAFLEESISSKFFCHLFLGSPVVLKQVEELCKGSTRLFLNQKILSSIMYPIPPLAEQYAIVQKVKELFTYANKLESQITQAQNRINKLTQSILAKAFRGELVPQNPDDEPAEQLLARIRAQREAEVLTKNTKKRVTRKKKVTA